MRARCVGEDIGGALELNVGDVLVELYREKGEALMSGRFMPSISLEKESCFVRCRKRGWRA